MQGLEKGANGNPQESRYCSLCGDGGVFGGSLGGGGGGVLRDGFLHGRSCLRAGQWFFSGCRSCGIFWKGSRSYEAGLGVLNVMAFFLGHLGVMLVSLMIMCVFLES